MVLLALMAPPQGGAESGNPLMFPLMMGILILIMYVLVIRPQQQQAKKTQAMIEAIKKGDRVLTSGGLYGKVVGIHENMVVLQIAREVNVEVLKSAISGVADTAGTEMAAVPGRKESKE